MYQKFQTVNLKQKPDCLIFSVWIELYSGFTHYSLIGNQRNSCLILANISFVSILGFQPIAFDRSARHRELVPNPDRPGYFLYSCSVKGVGTGLVVFPNSTIAFPMLSPTS